MNAVTKLLATSAIALFAVAGAHAEEYEGVHPLTTEPWGVTRFFVRAPDGNVVNVVQHRE